MQAGAPQRHSQSASRKHIATMVLLLSAICHACYLLDKAVIDAINLMQAQCTAAVADVQTQQEVNRQLMSRKEEIEWQLMTALAGHSGEAPDTELPHSVLLTDHNFDLASPAPAAIQPQVA